MDSINNVQLFLSDAQQHAARAAERWMSLLHGETDLEELPEALDVRLKAEEFQNYAQQMENAVLSLAISVEERALERAQRSKRKERATTPDAAEALTALQDLDEEEKAEDKDDHDSLYAEPRELDTDSEDNKSADEDPLADIPMTNFADIDYAGNEAMDEGGEDDPMAGGSSESNDSADVKKCNCKKSRCLKLYCECFSSGIFCEGACMCRECLNVVQFTSLVTETRQHIIDRSPNAFAPKVSSEGGHKKGCHCKKSRCLKKYCECYQANVPCTEACRCENCQNNGPNAPRDDSPQESSFFEGGALPLTSQDNKSQASQGKGSEGNAGSSLPSQSRQLGTATAPCAPYPPAFKPLVSALSHSMALTLDQPSSRLRRSHPSLTSRGPRVSQNLPLEIQAGVRRSVNSVHADGPRINLQAPLLKATRTKSLPVSSLSASEAQRQGARPAHSGPANSSRAHPAVLDHKPCLPHRRKRAASREYMTARGCLSDSGPRKAAARSRSGSLREQEATCRESHREDQSSQAQAAAQGKTRQACALSGTGVAMQRPAACLRVPCTDNIDPPLPSAHSQANEAGESEGRAAEHPGFAHGVMNHEPCSSKAQVLATEAAHLLSLIPSQHSEKGRAASQIQWPGILIRPKKRALHWQQGSPSSCKQTASSLDATGDDTADDAISPPPNCLAARKRRESLDLQPTHEDSIQLDQDRIEQTGKEEVQLPAARESQACTGGGQRTAVTLKWGQQKRRVIMHPREQHPRLLGMKGVHSNFQENAQGTEASKDWQGVEACNPGKENISNRSHSLQKGLAAGTQGHYGSRDPKSALTELNVN